MIKIEHSIVVNRPVDEVFAYATDVSKVPEWQTSALEARVDGTMQPGATGAIVRKFLGRRMESSVEFDEYEPPRKFALHATSGPVRFRVQQTYEPTDEGARRISCQGSPKCMGDDSPGPEHAKLLSGCRAMCTPQCTPRLNSLSFCRDFRVQQGLISAVSPAGGGTPSPVLI
jgi:hypothetical protein